MESDFKLTWNQISKIGFGKKRVLKCIAYYLRLDLGGLFCLRVVTKCKNGVVYQFESFLLRQQEADVVEKIQTDTPPKMGRLISKVNTPRFSSSYGNLIQSLPRIFQ